MLRTKEASDLKRTIEAAIAVAKQYRDLTGKPLGITGEVGEVLAAEILELQLAEARQQGYDAIGKDGRRVQIKARCLQPGRDRSPRMPAIKLDHDWDTVVLILMDENFEPQAIHEASRAAVDEALAKPGSTARNRRGALSVSKFKEIGTPLWPKA